MDKSLEPQVGSVKRSPVDKLNEALNSNLYNEQQYLLGVLLTIVDASFPDREQREAVKSLVRQAVWNQKNDFFVIVNQFASKYGKGKGVIEPSSLYDNERHINPTANYFPEL